MRTLVIGDVHGCAVELGELVERASPDRVVLVGDLYTKGPDPAGVFRFVRETGAEAVLGNHDERLLRAVDGEIPDDMGAHRCVATLDAGDPRWLGHLRALPLWIEDVAGYTVVHAMVHPSGDLEQTTREMALYWRRWPEDAPGAPHWHESYYGERKVIFGHDAVRGYVRVERSGIPWVVGLDTGCVYGKQLTGWIPETDELVQVPARRVYKPWK